MRVQPEADNGDWRLPVPGGQAFTLPVYALLFGVGVVDRSYAAAVKSGLAMYIYRGNPAVPFKAE